MYPADVGSSRLFFSSAAKNDQSQSSVKILSQPGQAVKIQTKLNKIMLPSVNIFMISTSPFPSQKKLTESMQPDMWLQKRHC